MKKRERDSMNLGCIVTQTHGAPRYAYVCASTLPGQCQRRNASIASASVTQTRLPDTRRNRQMGRKLSPPRRPGPGSELSAPSPQRPRCEGGHTRAMRPKRPRYVMYYA